MPTVKQQIKEAKKYLKKSPKTLAQELGIKANIAMSTLAESEVYGLTTSGAVREALAARKALDRQHPSKYRNKKTVVDGITFASKKEAKRYGELKLLEKAGEIVELELQKRFTLQVNKVNVCVYVADFVYGELYSDGNEMKSRLVVEDVKGCRTREYLLKKKLMLACYGIEIKEV